MSWGVVCLFVFLLLFVFRLRAWDIKEEMSTLYLELKREPPRLDV